MTRLLDQPRSVYAVAFACVLSILSKQSGPLSGFPSTKASSTSMRTFEYASKSMTAPVSNTMSSKMMP